MDIRQRELSPAEHERVVLARTQWIQQEIASQPDDTEAIKRLVETGFGCSTPPISAVSKAGSFYQAFPVQGQRLIRP
jgi:hypothetical protein